MKLIIFGASGSIGKQLVQQALHQGHIVTAFVRDKDKMKEISHPALRLATGDVLQVAPVLHAVKEQDAVLCALGAGRNGIVRAAGTQNIINGMEAAGIRRLVCQTTLGCGESWQNLNFFWKHIMFGWFLKKAFADHVLQEKYIMESRVNWTIVRPAAFTDGPLSGNYKHGFGPDDRSLTLKISRADVAGFMLAQLNETAYLQKATGLSY